MSRATELKALAEVLEDPSNQDKTTEEISQLLIDAIDGVRSKTHRLAVVAQLSMPSRSALTLVLGPFASRGTLDTPDKFLSVVEGGSSARNEGQGLAWDTKTGTGRGRFMLAPAFMRPRQAWDFYRPSKDSAEDNPMNFLVPPPPHIAESIARWDAGAWANEVDYGPACHCGLREHARTTSLGDVVELGPCPKHREESKS